MPIRNNRKGRSGEAAVNAKGGSDPKPKRKVKTLAKYLAERKAKEKEITPKRFKKGQLKEFIIKEHATKVQNKLLITKGEDKLKDIKNLSALVRTIKYKLPRWGKVAIINVGPKETPKFMIAKVNDYEDFGTDTLYYLDVEVGKIKAGEENYAIRKKYKVNPNKEGKEDFVVLTYGIDKANQEATAEQMNKAIGYKMYDEGEVEVPVAYIPAAVILNDEDGRSEIENMEQIFGLERQLLQEIPRDLDLSRKKIIYKSRLSRKDKFELQIEMKDDELVVFDDGDAVFTSPIDLWSPALAIQTITECIDWLVTHVLKMTFASRDSMSTGTNKLSGEVAKLDQAPNNYLDDKLQAWSEVVSNFFTKIFGTDVEVEFQPTDTIKLVKAGAADDDGTQNPTTSDNEGDGE